MNNVLAIGFASQTPSSEDFNSAQRSAMTDIATNTLLSTNAGANKVFTPDGLADWYRHLAWTLPTPG